MSIDLDECIFRLRLLLSTLSAFSLNELREPREPSFVFVREFVLMMDLDLVTTITTSVRGDYKDIRCEKKLKSLSFKVLTFSTLNDSRCVNPLMLNPLIDKIRSPRFKRPSLSAGELTSMRWICEWIKVSITRDSCF